ncbi:MAG: hypothetical protein QXD38_08050 [Ignisphaera sp.]
MAKRIGVGVVGLGAIGKVHVEAIKDLEKSTDYIKLVSELIGGGSIKLRAGSATGLKVEDICRGCATLIFLITPDICSKT